MLPCFYLFFKPSLSKQDSIGQCHIKNKVSIFCACKFLCILKYLFHRHSLTSHKHIFSAPTVFLKVTGKVIHRPRCTIVALNENKTMAFLLMISYHCILVLLDHIHSIIWVYVLWTKCENYNNYKYIYSFFFLFLTLNCMIILIYINLLNNL